MSLQTLNTPRETTHQRIADALEDIVDKIVDTSSADNIDYDNTTSGLSANKVQGAIDELALAGFVTNTVNNLVNYYLKSETYNKAEVDSLINTVKNSRFEAVSTLPTTNIKTNVIYLVPKSPTQTNNAKDEYINLDGTSSGWEKIGDTEVDLSGYVTTTALNTALSNYTTTANLTNLLNNKVDKVNGKGLSTNDYTDTEKQKLSGIEAGANKTVVDSAMSDSSTNPLQNKVITKELEGAKTTTGNPITVKDAAPVNAVNLSMDLEPIQDLHGYDHPWVGGAGKNKLPMTVEGIKAANTSGTWSGNAYTRDGVTFTVNVDENNNITSIKVNGTASANTGFDLSKLNTTSNMILSGCPSNGSSSTYSLNTNVINKTDYGSGVTLYNGNNVIPYIKINSGYAFPSSGLTFYPMIRLSTETDSSFAPYTNICPISGRSEVAIQRVGNNLFDKDTSTDGYRLGSDGTLFAQSGYTTSDFIRVNSSTNYVRNKTMNTNECVCLYDAFHTFISRITTGATFATTSATAYAKISLLTTDKDTTQLELGSTATTYEPYAGKTYTIQLGQTVYGGTLDVTKGKMVVTKGSCKINELEWGTQSSDYANFKTSSKANEILKSDNQIVVISELYIARSNQSVVRGGKQIYSNASGEIKINDTRYSTTTDFINAVGNSVIVYELAEPFTIDLTPQQIKLLENTNTIYTDYEGDTITIEYQPNNAIGEAVRVVEESYDPEFAVRPVLKKKAFSGTTDSDGSVTLINASDIPSGHKIIPLQITDMTIDGSAGTYFVEYEPYNSGDSVKGYCYTYFNGSQITPVGKAITGNFYYYDLEG